MKTQISVLLILVFGVLPFARSMDNFSPRIPDFFSTYHSELFENPHTEVIENLNSQAIAEIQNYNFEPSVKRSSWISENQAIEVFNSIISHPVVGWRNDPKYDPNGNYGFCFGRALYVHLELLRRGVQKEAIKKAFVVGSMESFDIMWQFHVATIVKGPGNTWWVIDTRFEKVLTLEEWYQRMKAMSTDNKLRLYISDPNRIGPAGWTYNTKSGGLFTYNNYFQDMFQFFKENPLTADQKFLNPPLEKKSEDEPKSCQKILL